MADSRVVVTTALLALALVPFPQQQASASCSAPYLKDLDEVTLTAGATVTVQGRAFTSGCQDSMSCSTGLGCQSCEYDAPPPVPMEDVELRLRQGERSWVLAVADAGSAEDDQLGWVEWTFEVPAGVRAGRARLVAEGSQAVPVKVR